MDTSKNAIFHTHIIEGVTRNPLVKSIFSIARICNPYLIIKQLRHGLQNRASGRTLLVDFYLCSVYYF